MKLAAAVLAALLAGHVALAQPPEDSTDVDDTTTAAEAAPLAPAQGAQAVEAAGAPAFLTDSAIRLDGSPTASDRSYETRVLGAFRNTQGAQGPLDGAWRVSGTDGALLYTLQLTDPGAGEARIEGAWRNPRQTGPAASGFIDWVTRDNEDLVLVFREAADAGPTQVRMRSTLTGGWVGETLIGEHRTGVTVNRNQGLETASMSVPAYVPPAPPRAKAQPTRKSKAKVKSKSKAKGKPKARRKR